MFKQFFKNFFASVSKAQVSDITSQQKLLETTGEKIIIDIDNCDFKTNNFEEEIAPSNFKSLDAQLIDGLFSPESNYQTEEINQTRIIYHNKGSEKFISQVFLMDEVTLQFHVIKNEITLFVDKLDRTKYFFDLKRKS